MFPPLATDPAFEKAGFAWPVDHQGINIGGVRMKMQPRDMVKLDPAFAAVGYGGQLIEVVPRLKLVVVFSTKFNDSDAPATVHSDVLEGMVSRVIAPALTP